MGGNLDLMMVVELVAHLGYVQLVEKLGTKRVGNMVRE